MGRQKRVRYVVSDPTSRNLSTYTLRLNLNHSHPHTRLRRSARHRDLCVYDGRHHNGYPCTPMNDPSTAPVLCCHVTFTIST